MLIVSGRLYMRPERRAAFLVVSHRAVALARGARGCRDFVVAADPLEANRVNVYEEWETEADLEAFRGSGPDDDLSDDILSADVSRYEIASSGPA